MECQNLQFSKAVFDCSLGDGCIDKRGVFHLRHCLKQKEYIEWKYELISQDYKCSSIQEINQNNYPAYRFYTITDNNKIRDEILNIRNTLYPNGIKTFSKEVVDLMDLKSFAILYMDDGSLTAKKRNGIIHAYDLTISIYGSEEECNNLIKKLDEYGLKFTIKVNKGKYSIRCGTKSARKFIELILPYCPNLECFKTTKFKELQTDSTYLIHKFKSL